MLANAVGAYQSSGGAAPITSDLEEKRLLGTSYHMGFGFGFTSACANYFGVRPLLIPRSRRGHPGGGYGFFID